MTEQLRAATGSSSEPKRRRGRLWLLLMIVTLVSAYGVYLSPVLRLQGAEVEGNQRLTAARVVEAAEVVPGAPRWEHPAFAIEQRLRQEPWIATAEVKWTWNRLHITVTERSALALLPYQGKWVMLDHSGMILELVDSPAGHKLPVIAGVATGKALRGQQLNHEGLSDALFVLYWMEGSYSKQISEVHVKPDGQLLLFMVGGAQVEWGQVTAEPKLRQQEITDKIKLFGRVWLELPKRGSACTIDMRPPGRAVPSVGCTK